jgi:malonyl-CoA/methylmalonyl-CoA synthetase
MDALFPRLLAPPELPALAFGGEVLSWRRLARLVSGYHRRLAAAGVGEGARVGVWTQPALETLVALVANAASGRVTVPLDVKLGPLELGHVLANAEPAVTVAADPAAVVGRAPGLPVLSGALEEAEVAPPARAVDDEPLLLLYTSGTTGLPKGAVLTARNVAADLDGLKEAWAWTEADTVVHALPLFHVHGLVLGLYGALRVGGALRWLPRFEPREVGLRLQEGRTVLFAVPTMYHRLADAAAGEPEVVKGLAHARLLISGSAGLPLKDHQRLQALTGRRVLERYGLTETLINCAERVDRPAPPGAVGPPLPGVELSLLDDAGREVPWDDATLGEIRVRGPHVFPGYHRQPEATAKVKTPDGWFSTGDLAVRRPDGAVRLVGRRATDLIKCGGFKVGAGEVEAALLEHPAVSEAAVLGAPDPDLGERIVAFVVLSASADPAEISAFVASQLSPHKRPRDVRVVAALPRNAMGKVVKQQLREQL